MGSITAANAVYLIAIPGLVPVPVQLKGFAADDIFGTDPQNPVETNMGVDGILSGGFVNVPTRQSITLQADSASNLVFDNWNAAQVALQDTFPAIGSVWLTSIGRKWAMVTGFLTEYPGIQSAGRTLRTRRYAITWQSAIVAPV